MASLYISMYYTCQEYVDAIVRKKTDKGFHQAARSIIRRDIYSFEDFGS